MGRFLLIFSLISFNISAQEVLRGEVQVVFEPLRGNYVEDGYSIEQQVIYRRALEESAFFYSAMIYGWSFNYDVGERARGIAEDFELTPIERIRFGDPGLSVTDVYVKDMRLHLWTDYRLNADQQRRMRMWRLGSVQTAQATGRAFIDGAFAESVGGESDWDVVKNAALEDAARLAVRTMLRGSERNRPKEVTGFISLASFPHYWIEAGQWAASARFRIEIKEIIPFSLY